MLVRQRTQVLCSYKERLEQANADLLSLAITDPLTGLLNRRKFEEVIAQEVERALRYGPLSLLMIDVNLFKQVNDQYGHQAGDEALKTVAGVLKSACRSTDFCARLGGDEFAVVLPHADAAATVVVRDRILHSLAATPVPLDGGLLTLSLSIGIASLPDDATASEGLIAAADSDMYRVKQASRSQQSLVT
jgi:diguanylate cyclase (GGDEF)-like protein